MRVRASSEERSSRVPEDRTYLPDVTGLREAWQTGDDRALERAARSFKSIDEIRGVLQSAGLPHPDLERLITEFVLRQDSQPVETLDVAPDSYVVQQARAAGIRLLMDDPLRALRLIDLQAEADTHLKSARDLDALRQLQREKHGRAAAKGGRGRAKLTADEQRAIVEAHARIREKVPYVSRGEGSTLGIAKIIGRRLHIDAEAVRKLLRNNGLR